MYRNHLSRVGVVGLFAGGLLLAGTMLVSAQSAKPAAPKDPLAVCSAAAKKTIKEKAGTSPVLKVEKVGAGDDIEYGVTIKRGNQDRMFAVADDGEFLGWETAFVELSACPAAVQKTIKENTASAEILVIEDAVDEFAVDIKKAGKEMTFYVLANGTLRAWQEKILLTECPAPVQKTIQEKAKGTTIVTIFKETKKGNVTFAVTTEKDNTERAFIVAADGKFLEWEDE